MQKYVNQSLSVYSLSYSRFDLRRSSLFCTLKLCLLLYLPLLRRYWYSSSLVNFAISWYYNFACSERNLKPYSCSSFWTLSRNRATAMLPSAASLLIRLKWFLTRFGLAGMKIFYQRNLTRGSEKKARRFLEVFSRKTATIIARSFL